MRYYRPAYILVPLLLINARANAQNRNAPSLPEESAAEDDTEEDLGTQLEELRDRLRQAEDARAKNVSPLSINGYVDFGFFVPLGNKGIGWVRDNANRQFPKYAPYSWTFLGDILGSPVNSRGEAADLGNAPGVTRFDSVNSGGAPGFILNEINLRVGYQLAERVLMRTSVNFVPRSPKGDFQLGDFFDADLAEMEYVVTDDGNTSISPARSCRSSASSTRSARATSASTWSPPWCTATPRSPSWA